jgi:hypothetical protein
MTGLFCNKGTTLQAAEKLFSGYMKRQGTTSSRAANA